MNTRSFLLSSLIAGAAIGLLGSLPVLNFVNCLLCIWVWGGGLLAVYVYRRFQPGQPALSPAQGAGLGAVAGLVGAGIGAVVFLLTSSLSLPLMQGLARMLQVEGDLPFQSGGFTNTLISTLIFLVIDLVLYPLFGALGGLIGASVFKTRPGAGSAGVNPT